MPNSADEIRLCYGVALCHPPRSALANHVSCLDPLQRPPRRGKRAIAFRQPDPLLHRAMILFHHVIQILALAQLNSARENPFRFQRFHRRRISRVLVHVDHTRNGIGGSAQSPPEEALGPRSVSFGGEQELNRLGSSPLRDTDTCPRL